jgi:gliding motility-associated-like protein
MSQTFTASSSGNPATYTWSITPASGYDLLSESTGSILSVNFTKGQTYSLQLIVANTSGTFATSKLVGASKTALASFNASLIATGYPNEMVLTNYSSNCTKIYWHYSDQDSRDSSASVTKPYYKAGSYTISLIAIGTKGCSDTADYSFRISDSSSISLPNVFSPNDDGVNDYFKPLMTGISGLNAWVFNRDGVLMASWDKVNGTWDGHTTSGMACSDGVYFVVVKAFGFDGTVYNKKTSLTLIR